MRAGTFPEGSGRGRPAWAALLLGASLAGGTAGADAAGLLNAACTPGAKSIVKDYKTLPGTDGRGHGMAAFHRGRNAAGVDVEYMMLPWSMDSGRGDGGLSFWNWDDPATWSAPRRRKHLPVPRLREAHSTPTTDMVGGDWRTWVLQATTGFSVYDLDSVASPSLRLDYAIAGAGAGGAGSPAACDGSCATSYDAAARDYSLGAVWSTALAAPYLYVAQADNGLNIYEFTDPADPGRVRWVRRLDKSWFGHRVNQVWVMGSLMVAAAVEGNYGVTLLDISEPGNPVRKRRYDLTTSPQTRNAYAWTLNGGRLYGAGKPKSGLNVSGLEIYDLNSADFSLGWVGEVAGGCGPGGYASIQDGFAHIGLSSCYHKINVATGAKVTPTNPAPAIGIAGADNDFATPFGNAVFVGNDHHTTPGSMVYCHAGARDATPPAVNARMPRDGAANVRTTAGVGVSFTDGLKQWTVGETTLPIRRRGATSGVAGHYSYQLNIVNFRPAVPFDRGTTYEVEVTPGVKDLADNGASPATGSFQTEAAVRGATFGDPAHRLAWSVRPDLQDGAVLYGDRRHEAASIPDVLKGRTWISPADASRAFPAEGTLLSLDLAGATDVYVCADDRDPARPPWLASGWADSGVDLEVAPEGEDDGRRMSCHSRSFPAGTVALGGAGGSASQYVVVIGPDAPEGGARHAQLLPNG